MAANGAAEGAHAASRIGNEGSAIYTQGPPSGASTGRNFIENLSRSVDAAGQLGKDFFGRLHK